MQPACALPIANCPILGHMKQNFGFFFCDLPILDIYRRKEGHLKYYDTLLYYNENCWQPRDQSGSKRIVCVAVQLFDVRGSIALA
jgi:hypothetical protein